MITLEEMRAQLKDPPAAENDYIEECERAAVALFERATGRYFGQPATGSVVVVGSGTSLLYLPEGLSSVIAVSSRSYEGGDETVIATGDADGWVLRLDPGATHSTKLIRKGGHVWSPWLEYVVTGVRGYDSGQEPADVRRAVREIAALSFEQRIPVALGTVAPKVPMSAQQIIDQWRRIPV